MQYYEMNEKFCEVKSNDICELPTGGEKNVYN